MFHPKSPPPLETTNPEASNPGVQGLGFYNGYNPCINIKSDGFIGAAKTFTKTSPYFVTGTFTVYKLNLLSLSKIIAFIVSGILIFIN